MDGRLTRWGMVGIAVACLSSASAGQSPNFTPATEQAIKSYAIDAPTANVLIDALRETTAATIKDPAGMQRLMKRMELPFEEQIGDLAKDPAIGPVLKARGLSPQQYSQGVLALRAASLAQSGRTDGLARLASPANIAMLKANPDIGKRFAQAEAGK